VSQGLTDGVYEVDKLRRACCNLGRRKDHVCKLPCSVHRGVDVFGDLIDPGDRDPFQVTAQELHNIPKSRLEETSQGRPCERKSVVLDIYFFYLILFLLHPHFRQ
jgi:hypothetical protein